MNDNLIAEIAGRKDAVAPSGAGKATTWIGLGLSLFSMLIIRQAFRAVTPEPGTALTLAREACMFASAGLLVWLVRKREGLPLTSIGIGTSPLWKSLAWGVVIAIACIVPAAVLVKLTGYGHGAASQAFAKLPVWVVCIVVLRAGVVEELFYRGYAIERLRAVGAGRIASWAIPLAIFSAAHWTGGAANILIALVLGGILTAFYLWRQDLVSNMFGHFLVDFVANVL
ncbi:MAG: CPBP family intramembrane glutamic endopeptidase [Terriglobales bacterium]